jgi:hypothetical protein
MTVKDFREKKTGAGNLAASLHPTRSEQDELTKIEGE